MKHITSIGLLTLTAAAGFAQAAASGPAFTTTGNLGLTSDYVFRGLSQTAGKVAVSGGFDVTHSSGFSAGVWASNVSKALGNTELDFYANYGFKVASVDISVGYIEYTYEKAKNGGEINLAATFSGVTLKVSKGADGTLSDYYYEANYSYDVPSVKGLNLGLHVGRDQASANTDYGVALTYPIFSLAGTVAYSDLTHGSSITAVSLKKTF